MFRVIMCSLAFAAVAGCSHSPEENLAGDQGATVTWEALDKLESEGVMGVAYAVEKGDWGTARNELKKPEFEAIITEFEQAAVPATSPGGQAGKDAAVKQFQAAIKAAKDGASDADLKTAWEAALAAKNKLR